MQNFNLRTIILLTVLLVSLDAVAQKPKVQNDPTHDDKPLHFGFSLGFNAMNFYIVPTEVARNYFIVADVAKLQPGFHVQALS